MISSPQCPWTYLPSDFLKSSGTVSYPPRGIPSAVLTSASLEHEILFTAQLGKIFFHWLCRSEVPEHSTDFQRKLAKTSYTVLVFHTDKQWWLWSDFMRRIFCVSFATLHVEPLSLGMIFLQLWGTVLWFPAGTLGSWCSLRHVEQTAELLGEWAHS